MIELKRKKEYYSNIMLSPILDLSLLLIIFLAVTTEFLSGGEIKVDIPKGGTYVTQAKDVKKITMDKWGKIFYEGKVFVNPEEIAKLIPENSRVYIKADKDTPYKFVFTLLDTLRKSNIHKVSLAGKRMD